MGNVRIALVNFLFARKESGVFILRMDDTDTERSKPEFATGIEDDLRWLGLDWGESYSQSDRLALYDAAAETLKSSGRLYACYETPEELAYARKRARARGKPPIYDRAALALGDDERKRFEDEGRTPHWRFKLDHTAIDWDDLVRGAVHFEGANLSDPVLIRADGHPLYTLSSVVDDLDLGITHVVRGEDHVANTAAQVQIMEALGAKPDAVRFAHVALLADAGGAGLSKREGAPGLAGLRDDGIEPMAVNSLLALIGTSDAIEPVQDLDGLAAHFAWDKFSRATARFDRADLVGLNARLLHGMDFAEVSERLAALGIEAADEAFWHAVRPNLDRLADAAEWWRVIAGPVTPRIEDSDYLDCAAKLLPEGEWDEGTWGAWTGAVKDKTGRKGKALFHPLRLALTGLERGPELKLLLPLIGPERAAARLGGREA